MKNGTMSLSFGYVIERQRKRRDGITELQALDMFEVSIVPAPANRDTRVLSTKSMNTEARWDVFFEGHGHGHGHAPSVEDLRRKHAARGRSRSEAATAEGGDGMNAATEAVARVREGWRPGRRIRSTFENEIAPAPLERPGARPIGMEVQ